MPDKARFAGKVAPGMRVDTRINIPDRPGVTKTNYYFSYSGAMVIAEPLPILVADLDQHQIEIRLDRIGPPSFRATPQFTNHSFAKAFGGRPTFPVQSAAFPAVATEAGASMNYWEGPTEELAVGAPALPPDTLIVTATGPNSGGLAHIIEEQILRRFLEWLRALTDQWWIGRSYEMVSGPLHFLTPLDSNDRVVGQPTTMVALTTASPHMKPIIAEIWKEAGERAARGDPPTERVFATDSKFMFVSKEFRSAAVLACCAFEAARDRILDCAGIRKFKSTDLLKHLTKGFDTAFGRSLARERPTLAEALKAFWIARGEAAHGRPIIWRTANSEIPIESLEITPFVDSLDAILGWLASVESPIAKARGEQVA